MLQDQNGIYQWKYTSNKPKQDAYEELIPLIQEQLKGYHQRTELEQDQILDNIIQQIRQINVFPIFYFNDEGIAQEIQSTLRKTDICIIDDAVYTQLRNGLLLLDFLFPNLHQATTCNVKTSLYDRFYDDDNLKTCLKKFLMNEQTITNLRTPVFKIGRFYWDTPINFSPMRARIIAERFCPKNGVIYDYSAGYGGRMLGILTSQQNFTYIGTDPNKNTYYNLQKLGKYIEKETKRSNSYRIYNLCSEQLQLQKESVDFCFSCPPFFKKENYCNEDTQSINKYPIYQDWLNEYVRKTIQNCYFALKPNGVYCVDICDYTFSGKRIPLVEDWIKIAKEEGFSFKKQMPIKSRMRAKNNAQKEFIYLFTKSSEIDLPNYTEDYLLQASIKSAKQRKIKSYRRNNITICQYDINGNLEQTYNNYEDIAIKKEILKSKSCYHGKYYRIYYGDDTIPTSIEVKQPICEINGIYYFSQSDIGRALNVSRQAVSQAKLKNKNIINNTSV